MSPAPGSFVLDTSVAVAWYLPETFSAAAVYISLARSLQAPLITAERTTTPWVVRLGELVERVG